MARYLVVVCALWLAALGHAHADCAAPATDQERAACIGQDLRRADTAINDTYRQLRTRLDPAGAAELRRQEIDWINRRARSCAVDTKEPDRDRWIANLLRDYNKTVCVVRFTDQRVAQLQAQEAALANPAPATPTAPSAAPPADLPLAAPATQATGGEVYDLVAQRTLSTGKWYFEATLNEGDIAREAAAAIFIGVQGLGASSTGILRTIHHRDSLRPSINLGVAVDLDAGKLYIRINGAWQATPGSSGGLDLILGRNYDAKLTSSVPIGGFLDRGVIDFNLGHAAFRYTLPDGYVAWDTRDARRIYE